MFDNDTQANSDNSIGERTQISIVLDALRSAESEGVDLDRQGLIRVTGLRKGQVDDALARLREKGIVDDKPKSYKLMPDFKAARPVTVTFWPDGSVKLEIGSVCEILNPTEAMTVGQAMAGKYTSSMLQLATAQLSHDISKVSSEVVKIKEAQRR